MPNRSVDLSSWERSACYPRSTFYPLSDGPSIRNRRITLPCFRTWPTCRSLSQAGLCQYTQRTVAIRAEPALGSLRYPFGGDHPSQTTRQAVSPSGLGPRQQKGGISTAARRGLAPTGLCLPPILHIRCPGSALSCSKGSRGLSVPLRVDGIFTATTISPSSRPRQCPDRYTIRAGRNLPDKEFRYLRTVIVTAAVSPLTFRHRAGVRPYSSSFDFAKPCVFGKQSPGPLLCASPSRGPLLPKLRGHFA